MFLFNPRSQFIYRCLVLVLSTSIFTVVSTGAATGDSRSASTYISKAEKSRVIKKAKKYLTAAPRTVVHDVASRSQGSHHDFYSEGDYWWPNPENAKAPYLRRDGETNPENFVAHRHSMVRLSDIVATLTSAYLISKDSDYAKSAVKHIDAWFVQEGTRMNPSLLYGQAIQGRHTGRSIGIIDTIHLVEVARSIEHLQNTQAMRQEQKQKIHAWFRQYLNWLNTHPYGQQEKVHPNNHGVTWSMQAAAFARLVGDNDTLRWVRKQFKTVYLNQMMNSKGGFPAELQRTKPYGYSLFVIDAMAGVAELASTAKDNLWAYSTSDGKSMQKGLDFILPYIENKSSWPYAKDIQYWDDWPARHPVVFLHAIRTNDKALLKKAWKPFDADPTTFEVLRNLPIRHPVIWIK